MTSTRPLIGVTTQSLQAIDGIPEGLPSSVVMNERYHLAAAAAGAAPMLVPLLADDLDTLRAVYERLDGLLIPGGVDIDPARYGDPPHAKLGRIDAARDTTELQLATWAIAEKKPVLGLCRGVQVINVAAGGTLYQDIGDELPGALKHDCFPHFGFARDHKAHDVELSTGSRVRDAMRTGVLGVNSLHHQAIKELGRGLRVTATAPDGVIEAIESTDGSFVVGVQWHPEVFEPTDEDTRRLFRAFVSAAATR
jgi:putative glutamine amidotransferase